MVADKVWPQGWQRVSSLAKLPPGDLVVKAVVSQSAHQSGGHILLHSQAKCKGSTTVIASLLHVRELSVGCRRARPLDVWLPWLHWHNDLGPCNMFSTMMVSCAGLCQKGQAEGGAVHSGHASLKAGFKLRCMV